MPRIRDTNVAQGRARMLDGKSARNQEEYWHMEQLDIVIDDTGLVAIPEPTSRGTAAKYVGEYDECNGNSLCRTDPRNPIGSRLLYLLHFPHVISAVLMWSQYTSNS